LPLAELGNFSQQQRRRRRGEEAQHPLLVGEIAGAKYLVEQIPFHGQKRIGSTTSMADGSAEWSGAL